MPTPPSPSPLNRYALVIFDMDGTLTEELLDFPAIRRDLALPPNGGILEMLATMTPEARSHAEAILHDHEMRAAAACVLHEGAAELLAALKSRGIHTALLTRNSSACAQCVLTRHRLTLDAVATRDDLPHKPHPDSILNISRRFGVSPEQTLMVGDYLYDLEAARAAAVDSALLCLKALPPFAGMATYTVRRLSDVLALMNHPLT